MFSTSQNLEFPSLVSTDASRKRPAHRAPNFPANKRYNNGLIPLATGQTSAVPETDDFTWMDSFSLFDDSSYPEDSPFEPKTRSTELSCSRQGDHQLEETSARELIQKALDYVPSGEIFTEPQDTNTRPPPVVKVYAKSNDGINDDYYSFDASSHQLQTGSLQQEDDHQQLTNDAYISIAVSSTLNPTEFQKEALYHHVQSSIAMHPQQHQPSVDSSLFTVSNMKNSKEPMLLTLTSYPFRVLFANEAFSKLSSSSSGCKTSVIGESVFDTFNMEGRILRPCLATYPTLNGRLDNAVVWFTNGQKNEPSIVRCRVQAYPVTKRNDSSALCYFAVRFVPLNTGR